MAVTESVKIVFEVDDKALVSTVAQLQAVGKVSQEDAAKFNALSAASKAAGASLDGASKGAKQFAEASKDAAKSTTEVANAASDLKDVGSSLSEAGKAASATSEGFIGLRQRLAEAKIEVQQLAEQFGATGPEFEAAVARAGELQDEFNTLNRQIRLSNPEGKIQAFQNLGQGIVGAFQTATGALQAFGVENEAVQEIAQKFQGALNIVQGIQSVVGLKEAYQDVKVVLGLTTAAQGTLTTATTTGAAATTGAATATRGFAAALASTGIGAIVVALGALVGALILSSDATDEDTEAQQKNNQAREKAIDDLNKEIDLINSKNAAQSGGLNETRRELELARARGASSKEIFELQKKAAQQELNALIQRKAFLGEDFKSKQDAIALDEQIKDKRNELQVVETQFARDQRQKNVENFRESEQKKLEIKKKSIDDEIALLEEQQRGALVGVDDELQRIAIVESFRAKIQEKQIEKARLTGESVKVLEEKFANDNKQTFEELVAANEAIRDKDVADAEKAAAEKLAAEKKLLDEKKSLLQQEEQLALLQNQVAATSAEDLAEKNFKTQEDFLKKRIALEKEGSLEQQQLLAQLALLYKDYEQGKTDETKKSEQERYEAIREGVDLTKGLVEDTTSIIIEANQRQYDEEVASLEEAKEKGLITEEQYQARLKKLKQKAAEDQKKAAVFQATLDFAAALINALTFKPSNAIPAALIFATVTAAANLAKIVATPIPKFKKGTLAVPGQDTGDDSVMAMLRPGEAVIPTEINREYANTIKAIYTRKVSSKELNEFVESRSRMTVVKDEPVFNFNPVTLDALFKRDIRVSQMSSSLQRSTGGTMPTINVKADVDTYALSKAMAKNKTMEIGNPEQVAKALAAELSKTNNLRRQ